MKKIKALAILAILGFVASAPTKSDALPVPLNGPGITGCYVDIHWVVVAGGMAVAYPVIVCPS